MSTPQQVLSEQFLDELARKCAIPGHASMIDHRAYALAILAKLQAAPQAQPEQAAQAIPAEGCNYLALPDRICNKCGSVHKQAAQGVGEVALQERVKPWLMACFGPEIAGDREERNHRFLEEALELVQACGCTASEAHQLVDYTFGRPVGEKNQEVGGVMITLAALCLANGLDMHAAAETELARIWTMVEKIRAKQAAKPKHSPLPAHPAPSPAVAVPTEQERELRASLDAANAVISQRNAKLIELHKRLKAYASTEPVCFVSINKQGDVTSATKRQDGWRTIPLYSGPSASNLPVFDELPDGAVDDACAAGAFYRLDFKRAWEALRAALSTLQAQTAQKAGG